MYSRDSARWDWDEFIRQSDYRFRAEGEAWMRAIEWLVGAAR